MKDGKKKTSPTSKKAYTPPEGYRLKEPYEVELPNGETVTVDDELEIDPTTENPRAPKTTMRKLIQNLVGFIEYFKDNMTPEEICGFVSFMISAIVGNDKEKYDELIEAVKQSYEFEKSEAEIAVKKDSEATLSDLPHTGYLLLTRALDEQQVLHRKPTELILNNTKSFSKMFYEGRDLSDGLNVKVGTFKDKNKAKKDMITDLKVYTAMNDKILPAKLSPFVAEVFNGVCTLGRSGQPVQSPAMIYEVISGKRTTSPKALKRVENALLTCITTLHDIDWTDHAKMNGLPLDNPGDYIIQREPLLMMKQIRTKINGTDTNAFVLMSKPALYDYAERTGQLITIDRDLLNLDIDNREIGIIIKNHILRRIELMKNQNNRIKSNVITFEDIYNQCGIDNDTTERKRARKTYIFPILDKLTEKQYINGYTVKKDPKNSHIYYGVEIDYTPNPTSKKKIKAGKKEGATA